jgi:mannitol/fructose-specific phosphotransferase system IIA component (Ntr-type)
MKLSDILVNDALVPDLQAATRNDAIRELVAALANAGAVPKRRVDEIVKAVLNREAKATTGIGKGVALPHERIKGIKKPVGTIGRSSEGIDFNALDSKPVYSIILMVSGVEDSDIHLEAMETVFKHLQQDMFRKFLRQSETKEAMIDLINEADELG